ncbi:hypothetical protein ABZ896_33225 [Streptomyces sp. NPDC047072]|uniref:hypothetical protein n=1 Tax=Streptomyces sp. NPDC047072 TaxID=3154809 RepID=UPI0033D40500
MDVPVASNSAAGFYSVSDRRFFPGLVALLNSLRLVGHDEPLFVVDAGLTRGQRELLADHVELLPAPSSEQHPVFLAPAGPAQRSSDVAVLIDADIIVTRPLTEIIETARGGRVVGFVNDPPNDVRFYPEWGSVLGLGPLRRQPYLNAGVVAFPETLSRRLLPSWIEGQKAIGVQGTRYGRGALGDPFYFADQDVLNAILSSRFGSEELLFLAHRLAPHPPFPGVALIDERNLTCRYGDGSEPFLLHHVLAKPWLKATRDSVYSTLLSRLLLAPDVTLRLDPRQVPLRLRQGWAAAADRRRADMTAYVRDNGRRQLGRFGIRTRLARLGARHAVP